MGIFKKKCLKGVERSIVSQQEEENNGIEDRIIIIGNKITSRRAKSLNWYEVTSDLNIADFNKVVIDFSMVQHGKGSHPEVDNLFLTNYNNLIFNTAAELIIIGLPNYIKVSPGEGPYGSFRNPLSILPVAPLWKSGKGSSVKGISDEFKFYFTKIKEWQFHFEYVYEENYRNNFEKIRNDLSLPVETIEPNLTPIAINGYDRPIAAEFHYSASGKRLSKEIQSCRIVWLPPYEEEFADDIIMELLETLWGISSGIRMPSWVNTYTLNSIDELKNEIEEINAQITEREKYLSQVNSKYLERIELYKLLFDQGHDLEKIVRKALSELGCTLIDVSDSRNEDVRFVDPNGNKWICEIKGRKGNLKRDDIRQLDDWVKQAILNEGWEGYAAIIGNFQCTFTPNDRKNVISDNEENAIKRFGFSIIETVELFGMIARKELNEINLPNEWAAIKDRGEKL